MSSPPPPPPSLSTRIKTTLPTLPLPPSSARAPILTPRLLLRPLRPSDLPALWSIRSDPAVMRTSPAGRPDADMLRDTKPVLDACLSPNDAATFYFAICLRGGHEDNGVEGGEGEMVGLGGCYRLTSMFGWPVVGYMLRREVWGRGLGTEFLRGWLGAWRGLERRRGVEVVVDGRTVQVGDGVEGGAGEGERVEVPEQIVTWAVADNVGSWRVMEKAGFEHLVTWREADLRDPTVKVELKAYRYFVAGGE